MQAHKATFCTSFTFFKELFYQDPVYLLPIKLASLFYPIGIIAASARAVAKPLPRREGHLDILQINNS
jgi:hypothetical protein